MGKALETTKRYDDAVRYKGEGLEDVLADDVTFNGPLDAATGMVSARSGYLGVPIAMP